MASVPWFGLQGKAHLQAIRLRSDADPIRMTIQTCARGHAFDQGELRLTGWRLPCGCPLTNTEARKLEGVPEEMAAGSARHRESGPSGGAQKL